MKFIILSWDALRDVKISVIRAIPNQINTGSTLTAWNLGQDLSRTFHKTITSPYSRWIYLLSSRPLLAGSILNFGFKPSF